MTRKILICDDYDDIAISIKNRLDNIEPVATEFETKAISGNELKEAVLTLEDRLVRVSDGEKKYPTGDASDFDTASILVIDYELIKMSASITGERIAYLARCYSKCGLIIALNQYPPYGDEYFDLTLHGHPESFSPVRSSPWLRYSRRGCPAGR